MSDYEGAALYRAEQVRELDRRAIQDHGIPGIALMERAGKVAFDVLQQRWPRARKLLVVAGAGNNAGDGFIVAALARQAGLAVRVVTLSDPQQLQGEALEAWWQMQATDLMPEPFSPEPFGWADVVVDAILGTGLRGAVREPFAQAIEAVNAADCPVLALDIPSGLCADTGQPLGVAVRAAATVSFIGLKQGLFLSRGPDYRGELHFDDLGVPRAVYHGLTPGLQLLGLHQSPLASRRRDANKGDFGHVLVVGGAPGFGGAARLAGEAALRSGAGLVSIATHPLHAAKLMVGRPELMCHPVVERGQLQPLLERASVVVLGPGLGLDAWGQGLWDAAVDSGLPLVLDADGLNRLATLGELPGACSEARVLTPHPGEAARLLQLTTAEVEQDRIAAVTTLRDRFGGTLVLKGAGTLVLGAEGPPGQCPLGNPGMASGGMGDLLAGVIGALLAQGLEPAAAAALGVCLHAAAGDEAAAEGQRGMLASDLLAPLRRLCNPGL